MSKQLTNYKNLHCLNCNYPFFGHEKFCPECGQKNKKKKITFGNFVSEIFAGFFSWDTKFWRTILPLLVKPGRVTDDYINGKRARYVNPFRFYITTSIIFFLTLSLTDSYTKYNKLNGNENTQKTSLFGLNVNKNDENFDLEDFSNDFFDKLEKQEKEKDSLNKLVANGIITTAQKDSIYNLKKGRASFSVSGNGNNLKFILFKRKHPKMKIDDALDSLKVEKTFMNRFWYSRSDFFHSMLSDEEASYEYMNKIISYSSIALFVMLPLFTLFLVLLYIRKKKYTYIEHLIFVFHIQTVFFILFTLFVLLKLITNSSDTILIFTLLFLIYLFLSMKNFYKQSYSKTLVKFVILNGVYAGLTMLGMIALSFIAFALY